MLFVPACLEESRIVLLPLPAAKTAAIHGNFNDSGHLSSPLPSRPFDPFQACLTASPDRLQPGLGRFQYQVQDCLVGLCHDLFFLGRSIQARRRAKYHFGNSSTAKEREISGRKDSKSFSESPRVRRKAVNPRAIRRFRWGNVS